MQMLVFQPFQHTFPIQAYTRTSNTVIQFLTPFPSTWLCEIGFLICMTGEKQAKNKSIIKPGLWYALETTPVGLERREKFFAKMQHRL